MQPSTIAHWQTLSSEELATSDATGNVQSLFCLHRAFAFIYSKRVLESTQNKSILSSCAKIFCIFTTGEAKQPLQVKCTFLFFAPLLKEGPGYWDFLSIPSKLSPIKTILCHWQTGKHTARFLPKIPVWSRFGLFLFIFHISNLFLKNVLHLHTGKKKRQ